MGPYEEFRTDAVRLMGARTAENAARLLQAVVTLTGGLSPRKQELVEALGPAVQSLMASGSAADAQRVRELLAAWKRGMQDVLGSKPAYAEATQLARLAQPSSAATEHRRELVARQRRTVDELREQIAEADGPQVLRAELELRNEERRLHEYEAALQKDVTTNRGNLVFLTTHYNTLAHRLEAAITALGTVRLLLDGFVAAAFDEKRFVYAVNEACEQLAGEQPLSR